MKHTAYMQTNLMNCVYNKKKYLKWSVRYNSQPTSLILY